jgi:hypothetical protein
MEDYQIRRIIRDEFQTQEFLKLLFGNSQFSRIENKLEKLSDKVSSFKSDISKIITTELVCNPAIKRVFDSQLISFERNVDEHSKKSIRDLDNIHTEHSKKSIRDLDNIHTEHLKNIKRQILKSNICQIQLDLIKEDLDNKYKKDFNSLQKQANFNSTIILIGIIGIAGLFVQK